MKKLNFVLIIFLILSISVYSQSRVDVIKLKNGDIYQGQIIKDVPGDYIQIEMKSGLIKMIKYPDIESRESKMIDEYGIESADDTQIDTTVSAFSDFMPRAIDLSLNIFDFDYAEHVIPPMKSTENGIIKGFGVGVVSNPKYPYFISLGLNYSWAEEDYDGSTQAGIPHKTKTNSSFTQFIMNLGYSFQLSDNFKIEPFLGYDIRSWDREITGEGGIEEIYSWQNIPMGCGFEYQASPDFEIGFIAHINLMINGKIKILFSKIDYTYPDISLNLGNVTGLKVMLPMKLSISDGLSLNLSPYYEKYAFDKSNSFYQDGQELFYEPSSTTYLIGANAGVTIKF